MVQFLAILLGAQKAKTDQRGASAVEYGLLVAALAALIIVAVWAFYDQLVGVFDGAGANLEDGGR
ncbi:Flp family type IVb pilin [Nocardioides alkalitolerans]|uniref:Flp family type IVb pilin n=1 Tax=Nocardioides alkalitolerans TaxID=281714 RepID=UPI00040F2B6D|nr:Flp family type IVb pilin [Nocardioides alkalitolerans]